jgi:MFS family permease
VCDGGRAHTRICYPGRNSGRDSPPPEFCLPDLLVYSYFAPRRKILKAQLSTIIIATSIVQLANGFFNTFISLRVAIETFDASGFILSAYFAGFTVGALRCKVIIERIGHIRAYAAFAGLVAASTVIMPLIPGSQSWVILRFLIGFGCAGIFVTTESWLSSKADPASRGRVFSIYMVGTFLALALGQLLIARISVESATSFNTIVALFSLALILVTMAHAEQPTVEKTESLPYNALLKAAPIAVLGCIVSGLIGSAFYSLVPAWMQSERIEREAIALFMLLVVLGGFTFQIPIGKLSDRFDRRGVLALLGLGFAIVAIAMVLLPHRALHTLLPEAFLLGGFMSTLYPVCVSYAHDNMPVDKVVAVSGQLILISGLGSVVGPLVGETLMVHFGINALFALMALAAMVLALVTALTSGLVTSPLRAERPFRFLTPQAGPLAHGPEEAATTSYETSE